MDCSKCGRNIDDDSKFCKYCGADLKKTIDTKKTHEHCYECGYAMIGDYKFCSQCGTKIKEK